MKEVLERLSTSVHHLKIIHEFFLSPTLDMHYKIYRYTYYGQDGE